MKNLKISKINLSKLPETPGVYLFSDATQKVIYVGKSVNLKSRVNSYFLNDLEIKTRKLIQSARFISFIKVDSEFEALILEAQLVRKLSPKYNSQLKDDKSPLYIGITDDEYPRIITLRKTQIKTIKLKRIFGPFLESVNVRKILKYLRKIFPYSNHRIGKKACIYSQIGLCDPCPNEIETIKERDLKKQYKNEYITNIRKLSLILSGKLPHVRNNLEREMQKLAKSENYEQALELRNKLNIFDYITSQNEERFYIENPNLIEDIRNRELIELKLLLNNNSLDVPKLVRIECFDIAHLAGSNPTASMVTFINAEPNKSLYRHFKLIATKKYDDLSGMKEVLIRRKKAFTSWGTPDLIIVDGGKTQLNIAIDILGESFPVVGLAKKYETIVIKNGNDFSEIRLKNGSAKRVVQRIRNEAHRFARRLHHKLVAKALLG